VGPRIASSFCENVPRITALSSRKMPTLFSTTFGALSYGAGEQFMFPNGLPGFPQETAFLPVEVPEQLPLLYLQSVQTPNLCFVTLPVNCLLEGYKLSAEPDDLNVIGLGTDTRLGPGILCLAILCFAQDGTADANLRAPLVINLENRKGIQAIQSRGDYAIRFPVGSSREVTTCS